MSIFDSYYKGRLSFAWLIKKKKLIQAMEMMDKTDDLICISQILKKYVIKTPQLVEWTAKAIYQLKNKEKTILEINNEYVPKFEMYPASKLSWKKWNNMRYVLTWNGMLYLGHICREKSEKMLLSGRGRNGILARLTNKIEHGCFDEVEAMFKSPAFHEIYMLDRKSYEECKECLETIMGRKKTVDCFGDYIKGKRVVIMGPAKHSDYFEDYDREHDRIVRFTYRGKEFLSQCDKDLPVDIAYYNGVALNYVLGCKNKEFLNGLQFMTIKGRTEWAGANDVSCNIRNADMFFVGVTFGQTNMVPNAIFDCMHYECDSIYVRNCNLFFAKEDHEAGYDLKDKKVSDRWREFAIHDFEGQFNLMKSFYEYGIFECDEECKDVLQMTNEEYILGMEQIYSNG